MLIKMLTKSLIAFCLNMFAPEAMISDVSPVKLNPIKKAPICEFDTEPLIINENAVSASLFVNGCFFEIL